MATTPYPFVANAILTASQLNSTFNIPVSTKTASYTLVASDAGTRINMNSASATTITVNTSLFAANDNLEITNIGAGVCTITAGTATVSTSGTLALAANAGGTLYFISAGVSVFIASGVAASGSGLVCVKSETAFVTAGNFFADSVFTSTYTNYRIIIRYDSTSTQEINFVLRASTSDAITNYNYQRFLSASTTNTGLQAGSQTAAYIAKGSGGSFTSSIIVELGGPQLAAITNYQSLNAVSVSANTTPNIVNYFGNHSTASSFDGIKFTVDSGTMTGTYTIYGYAKTV